MKGDSHSFYSLFSICIDLWVILRILTNWTLFILAIMSCIFINLIALAWRYTGRRRHCTRTSSTSFYPFFSSWRRSLKIWRISSVNVLRLRRTLNSRWISIFIIVIQFDMSFGGYLYICMFENHSFCWCHAATALMGIVSEGKLTARFASSSLLILLFFRNCISAIILFWTLYIFFSWFFFAKRWYLFLTILESATLFIWWLNSKTHKHSICYVLILIIWGIVYWFRIDLIIVKHLDITSVIRWCCSYDSLSQSRAIRLNRFRSRIWCQRLLLFTIL